MRKLEDLSLQELYELFPIHIVDFSTKYKSMYIEKAEEVKKLLKEKIVRISHIGSTAVQDMPSKPIVDILVEVESKDVDVCIELLKNEWGLMGVRKKPVKASFNQGYLITGYAEKVYHLHLIEKGNPSELYFRDILNENSQLFTEYLTLKLELLKSCEGDREAYTEGKSAFVTRVSEMGKSMYKNRYSLTDKKK